MRAPKLFNCVANWPTPKRNIKVTPWRWLTCVSLNLVLAMMLNGCASNCPKLNEPQRPTPIGVTIDVSDWQQKVRSYSTELKALLNSARKTTDSGTARQPAKP